MTTNLQDPPQRLRTGSIDALTLAVNAVVSMAADFDMPPIGTVDLNYWPSDEMFVATVSGVFSRHWLAPIEDLPGNGYMSRERRPS